MDKTTSRTFAAILTILYYGFNFVNCDENLTPFIRFTKQKNGLEQFHLQNETEMAELCDSVAEGQYISLKINSTRPVALSSLKMDLQWITSIKSMFINYEAISPVLGWDGQKNMPILTIKYPDLRSYKYFFVQLVFKIPINVSQIGDICVYSPTGTLMNDRVNDLVMKIFILGRSSSGMWTLSSTNIWKSQKTIHVEIHIKFPSSEEIGHVNITLPNQDVASIKVNDGKLKSVHHFYGKKIIQIPSITASKGGYFQSWFKLELLFKEDIYTWPISSFAFYRRNGTLINPDKLKMYLWDNKIGWIEQKNIKGGEILNMATGAVFIKMPPSDVIKVEVVLDEPIYVKLRTKSSELVPLQSIKEQVNNETLNVSLLFDNIESFVQTSDLELTLSCGWPFGNNWSLKAVDIYGQIDCETPDQGQSNVSIERDKRTSMTVWANYTCQEGQYAVGNTITVCQSNGNWSGPPPRCEEMKTKGISEVYIIGGATCLVVLLLAVTIICTVIIVRRSRRVALTAQDVHNTASTAGPSVPNIVSREGTDNSPIMDRQHTIPRQMELDQLSNVHQVDQSQYYMVDNDIYGDI